MTGMKLLCVGTVAAGVDAATSLPIEVWEKFGVVGLLILAVVAIYRDGKKDKAKLTELLERAIAAMQENTDVLKHCKEKIKR